MIAEILSVGTELLMGQIANTDAQYLSRRLAELGVTLYHQTVVGDNPRRVKAALAEALSRADVVITTGGLGPTEDDLTKEMVAEYFDLEMVSDEASLRHIEAFMCRIGHPVTERGDGAPGEASAGRRARAIAKQALFPRGAVILPNRIGIAPGCVVESGDKAVAVLPGPPNEMKDMFDRALAPYLARRSGAHIESRFIRVFGIGESRLEPMLADLFHAANPSMALYCGPGEVMVRVTAMAASGDEARAIVAPVAAEVRRRLGDRVYGEGADNSVENVAVERLKARGERVSVAESLTGGLVAARLVSVPGASNVLDEAHVTYADAAKHRVLGVRQETLDRHTAVSAECAREMAEGVRRISRADWGVSTTGYAGPDGGADGTPVGTVYIGVAGRDGTVVRECHFQGDRSFIRTLAASWALNELRLAMERAGGGA